MDFKEVVPAYNLEVTHSTVQSLLDFANAYITKYGFDNMPVEKKYIVDLLMVMDSAFLEEGE